MRRSSVRAWLRGRDEAQAIILVALLLTSLMGFIGLVVDVGWYQLNLVRVQRAADAAALAGAVYLPGNQTAANAAAQGAATQNGYTNNVNNGLGVVQVVPGTDATNSQMMNVTITAPIRTWFMRLFGIQTLSASRNARAEFILPVPMGSPTSYYGVHIMCADGVATPGGCTNLPSATGSGNLTTQGFWGAVESHGAQRANGDAFSTGFDTPEPGGINAGYDPLGYSYIVEFPTGTTNGKVYVFDPIFCPTGAGTSGGVNGRRLGVGDAYLVAPGSAAQRQMTTEFKLWDMNGTPYSTTDDISIGGDTGQFTNLDNVDKTTVYKGNQRYDLGNSYNGSSSTDCGASAYHNAWWQIPTPGYPAGLPAGNYRLQVTTSNGSTSQNAVNNFSLQATGDVAGVRTYGQSRMCVFNAISGTSIFYLSQIAAVHAGKTLEIKLFDPGDISNTSLFVQMPTNGGYVDATFSWTATGCTGGCATSGNNVTSLLTSTSGGTNLFNNQWVTISVSLPTSYTAPQPPGEPGGGWWKIKYATTGTGQDVTTWSVNIRGNPVHLVTP
ncbi:MAG: hypothetical protein QOH08_1083 [Chloroflexota bacterium]|nr:hypothetical protein [Chloroflexota bacterium]